MCNLRVLLTFLTISLITAIPTVHSLIRIRSSIMLIIDNLQLTMPVITIILKIVIFWWKREGNYDCKSSIYIRFHSHGIRNEISKLINNGMIRRSFSFNIHFILRFCKKKETKILIRIHVNEIRGD
jgi:hypothetical protein